MKLQCIHFYESKKHMKPSHRSPGTTIYDLEEIAWKKVA